MSTEQPDPTSKEPAVNVGVVTTFVTALIGLGVAFGLDITLEQKVAILAVIGSGAPLVGALIIRGKVYAPATVARMKRE